MVQILIEPFKCSEGQQMKILNFGNLVFSHSLNLSVV